MASTNGDQHPVTRKEFKAGLERLRRELASKADLGRMASKADLGRMASKADLGRMASKADLDRLASKADLDRLAHQVMKNTADIADIKERMVTRDDLRKIVTMLENLTVTYTHCWNKLTVHDERIRNLEEQGRRS